MDPSELDALFERPLAEFVSARNDLAKSLKLDGRKEDAKAVKALRRPSLPAWTINRLVRQHRDAVDRLLKALDDVRSAQIGQEEQDRKSLAEAMAAERAALTELEDAAIGVLEGDGHPASRGTLDRVMRSVRAAAADVSKRDELLRGQLIAEIADEGFDSLMAQLGAGVVPPARPKPKPEAKSKKPPPVTASKPPDEPEPPPVDLAAERARREAEARLARERERKERIADAKRLAEARRMELEKLEKDLAIAERELADAKRRLTNAEENHDAARRRTDLARIRRTEADAALQAAEADES